MISNPKRLERALEVVQAFEIHNLKILFIKIAGKNIELESKLFSRRKIQSSAFIRLFVLPLESKASMFSGENVIFQVAIFKLHLAKIFPLRIHVLNFKYQLTFQPNERKFFDNLCTT